MNILNPKMISKVIRELIIQYTFTCREMNKLLL